MDTNLGIHLTWTYASLLTKWLNSYFKIKTPTGKIETTEIKISDGGAYFPPFKSLYILKSLIQDEYAEIPFSEIIGGIKQKSSYPTSTLQGTIIFQSIEISSGYHISGKDFDNCDLSTFIDFGTAYNSEKDFVSFLGPNYKTKDTCIMAPRWDPQYTFTGQEYSIENYQENYENNLTLVRKDCIPIQPNSILDSNLNVSKWSRGKIFQNRLAHIEETYYIYKDNSSGNVIIKEKWEEEENGKKITKTSKTKYTFKTNNLSLDIQAPGGKGANGTTWYSIAAEGGGGGAFCRLMINLDLTTEDIPYVLILAACTTEENQSPNYCEFGLWNGIDIRLQSGYNGVTHLNKLGTGWVIKAGEGGKVYTTLLAPGPGRKWKPLEPETDFNYQKHPPCMIKTYADDNITESPIEEMILLSYAAGKSRLEGSFSSKDTICNGTSDTLPFFNEDCKRGYPGESMSFVKHPLGDTYGGKGGGASVLGYGQKGRSVGESMQDYDTDWHAYGGGGGGGASGETKSEVTHGTFGQPGCFIVYGLGDKIATEENSSN